uniref:RING-type E3 ubiquitin transferase n=1 Tax=Chromera velia CCMP2878 TaxID=1169474 RepID=A0A0G4F852_9ALVE|mmetsp:Transcript_49572/g.97634  ORF Transcript_49572/g.97634 Transcript_49572/m.97634 type:complete len:402 (-) Transcript_49572:155-1360(-)|eukprot:Cvel_15730.t1-p1 / transcript=Cvel_15730.t1 / gene=Cvel_15730 / organism=Chromera_velia_CCMP2878 / gene_product=Zinc finger CCCH domain-containing protein 15, putative / transcript_product=Zinc finger CCCH domain-containing protein 15, putative / location=Cvel_scaffold1176:37678-43376(+) / protein_length=401 / sequence_SO=supercontig / SO=protein_coding / is_pseudo=false
MFAKRTTKQGARKKSEEEENDEGEVEIRKKKAARHIAEGNSVATGTAKTRDPTAAPSSSSSSSSSSATAASLGAYESSRTVNLLGKEHKATALLEIDTARDQDHRAILERNQQISEQILAGNLDEKTYHGQGGYKQIANSSSDAIRAAKYTGLMGPIRGTQHIRMSARFDYQPDICKDYKETGYCGYGDSCIYLHDRSDYKSGWQLEREWQEDQKRKAERLARKMAKAAGEEVLEGGSDDSDSDDDSEDEEGIPFACLICREKWTLQARPVMTTCGHYFCERCALQHYSKNKGCAVCDRPTNGIFNSAEKIMDKLQAAGAEGREKERRLAVLREAATGVKAPLRAPSSDDSDDEEEDGKGEGGAREVQKAERGTKAGEGSVSENEDDEDRKEMSGAFEPVD